MGSSVLSTRSSNHFFRVILTLFVFLSVSHASSSTVSSNKTKSYVNFVKKSCNMTTYPTLCGKTLTPYASAVKTNPLTLCNVAINVAIQATSNCSARISKLARSKNLTKSDAGEIKDCMSDLKDSLSELKETANDMKHLGDADREFEWANARTAASAAITDAETCVDDLAERKNVSPLVTKKIKNCVSIVEPLISNSLALINHLY